MLLIHQQINPSVVQLALACLRPSPVRRAHRLINCITGPTLPRPVTLLYLNDINTQKKEKYRDKKKVEIPEGLKEEK